MIPGAASKGEGTFISKDVPSQVQGDIQFEVDCIAGRDSNGGRAESQL